MRDAVKGSDGALGAPSVGTWQPAIGRGAPVGPGDLLGHLIRDGRPLAVHVPAGVGGVVLETPVRGTWLAFDEPVARLGEGVLGDAADFAPPGAATTDDAPEGATAVRADTDGTVYLAPEPGKPPFAPQGTDVAANTTVALVEVMKTFTPARAPTAGTIVRVDVQDGGSVTAGQAILWIR